ncbi:hypothetical protein [Haliangium sp.]|uniref:hypothetical protein n=1 Tax=Haliangium sp. TaxID=2663208 RepID=UPI003D10D886
MASTPRYQFEARANASSVRSEADAAQEREVFRERLSIPADTKPAGPDETETSGETVDQLLTRYVVHVHLNISWYAERLAREKRWRQLYIACSVLLLLIIPALVWLLAHTSSGDSASVTAQISALITGVLGIHKAMAGWLDKRQLFGHFWRASAELKELLYSLEEEWKGRAVADGALRREFRDALRADIEKARQILHKERQGFYDLYQYPSFDIFHKLNEAFTQGRGLATSLRPAPLLEREAADKREAELDKRVAEAERRKRELDAQIQGLEELVRTQEQSLDSTDDRTRVRVEQSLMLVQQNLDQARYERIRVDAELASLR